MRFTRLRLLFLALLITIPAYAHVGSKDVFEQLSAGPYKLFVTVRTPSVIPGIATIEVRTSGATVDGIHITPVPLTGEASRHPPTPDSMQRSTIDPAFYTGSLWLMAGGSWQVRFEVTGAAGPATASVPVAAMPLTVLRMQRPFGLILAGLGLILALGFAGIVGAAVRESRLTPGIDAPPNRRRRALIATAGAFVFIAFAIFLGNQWWNVEAAEYAADIYHPLALHPSLSGNTLDLVIDSDSETLSKNGKRKNLALDDLLLDHGKIMHLYAIRQPEMDAAFHLHPGAVSSRHLRATLPAMPPGVYKLYADVVFANGFPETLTSTLTVPENMSSTPLAADDAKALPPPLSQGELGTTYKLPDGYTMVWDRPADLTANTATLFRFRLLDAAGKPAADTEPYLGMAGHAAFVKTDGTVFAHTHPDGSAAMPAMMLANGENPSAENSAMANMPGMSMSADAATIPPTVEFPYGFPSAGQYRIFVQMKHGAIVETGVFDAEAR
jgi:hypothetical protein